jgi:hypothetical protein
MNCSSNNALKSLLSSLLKFSLVGVALCSLQIPAQFLEQQETKLTSGPELFEAYLNYRETVGMLNPPLQMPEEERNLLLAESKSGDDLMTRIWGWWLSQPGWFMGHGGRADTLDERLIRRIWAKGDHRQLVIWEHPGKGMVYASLVEVETDSSEIIARRKAPDWVLMENETTEKFREREIGNRRVTWKFTSPYMPPPAPEPTPQPFAMMSMSAPEPLEISWDPNPPDVSVIIDAAVTQGPFTLWYHTTGDLQGSQALPGDWAPLHWQKELPASPWLATVDTSNVTNPFFLRVTAGIVDSEPDQLDDGYELWMFGDMQQTGASDYDGDLLSNADEYTYGTDPTEFQGTPENADKLYVHNWFNVSGISISNLTDLETFPYLPDEQSTLSGLFQTPQNIGDYFGQRIFGRFTPAVTGNYTFLIAGDGRCDLYLTVPGIGKQKIANAIYTQVEEWDDSQNQTSDPIYLEKGVSYNLEVLMKETTGRDHVEVGVLFPTGQSELPVRTKWFEVKPPNVSYVLDSDSDGLNDYWEWVEGTNPNHIDTDGDRVSDWDEFFVTHTDPLVADIDDFDDDYNGDGIDDSVGLTVGISSWNYDNDGDQLTNAQEVQLGTDPNNADTDGDGTPDNLDQFPLDPLLSNVGTSDPGDTSPPVIILRKPPDAVLQ